MSAHLDIAYGCFYQAPVELNSYDKDCLVNKT